MQNLKLNVQRMQLVKTIIWIFWTNYQHNWTNEKLVMRKLLIFKRLPSNPQWIKCYLQWWGKHEAMFHIVDLFSLQILSIIGSKIEIKRIFFLVNILTNLRKCHLQSKFLKKLSFVRKNWPSNFTVACESRSNLMKIIEKD